MEQQPGMLGEAGDTQHPLRSNQRVHLRRKGRSRQIGAAANVLINLDDGGYPFKGLL